MPLIILVLQRHTSPLQNVVVILYMKCQFIYSQLIEDNKA